MAAPSPDQAVTEWLDRLKAGDPAAAGPLWQGYYARLVALARDRLRATPRAAADEEDIALSAFDSFCRGAAGGRFPRLDDRDDLWRLLFTLTVRKAAALARHEGRLKRGGGLAPAPEGGGAHALDAVPAGGPTPDLAAAVSEECGRLLGLLGEGDLRRLAIWKMEGYTNPEIARMIGRSVPTVERKLALIRATWARGAGA